jgi:ribonuclease-3
MAKDKSTGEDAASRKPLKAQAEKESLVALEQVLGHSFQNPSLLRRALTHRSRAFESGQHNQPNCDPDSADNEQMEFLGDAVVGLLVTEWLYAHFPESDEGELTRMRSHLVSRRNLGLVGAGLGLSDHLRLGKSEERNGGRKNPTLLANGFEAVTGALYLDAGQEATRSFVERTVLKPQLGNLRGPAGEAARLDDPKSALQEALQACFRSTPIYTVKAESGPDHKKRFLIEVHLRSSSSESQKLLARGIGPTKKRAEQEAARRALLSLKRSAAKGSQGEGRP